MADLDTDWLYRGVSCGFYICDDFHQNRVPAVRTWRLCGLGSHPRHTPFLLTQLVDSHSKVPLNARIEFTFTTWMVENEVCPYGLPSVALSVSKSFESFKILEYIPCEYNNLSRASDGPSIVTHITEIAKKCLFPHFYSEATFARTIKAGPDNDSETILVKIEPRYRCDPTMNSGGSYNVAEAEQSQHTFYVDTIVCNVYLLDSTCVAFKVDKHCRGQSLLDLTFDYLELLERDFFGLVFNARHSRGETILKWLDPTKVVGKQCSDPAPYTFWFRVKFYVPDPVCLHEEYTRYQFFLQVRKDILEGRLPVPKATASHLAGLVLQAELGDYIADECHPGYTSQFRLLPHQSPEFDSQASEWHRKCRTVRNNCGETELYELHLRLFGNRNWAVKQYIEFRCGQTVQTVRYDGNEHQKKEFGSKVCSTNYTKVTKVFQQTSTVHFSRFNKCTSLSLTGTVQCQVPYTKQQRVAFVDCGRPFRPQSLHQGQVVALKNSIPLCEYRAATPLSERTVFATRILRGFHHSCGANRVTRHKVLHSPPLFWLMTSESLAIADRRSLIPTHNETSFKFGADGTNAVRNKKNNYPQRIIFGKAMCTLLFVAYHEIAMSVRNFVVANFDNDKKRIFTDNVSLLVIQLFTSETQRPVFHQMQSGEVILRAGTGQKTRSSRWRHCMGPSCELMRPVYNLWIRDHIVIDCKMAAKVSRNGDAAVCVAGKIRVGYLKV
ncbi:tyrosine-protein phosphatase non-receptor type 4 [Clonorchis sinensis]|uniref:Tyrosine-protein phosphatase non-receptor type 4 n=1 Tax=Clonorchis sinensis TaxID=79923 RepID=G7YBP5_CLOSI|nr:tyrosine-protein phosphatase non-receptor type 4 [Clonorchis sinensis]